MRKIVLTAATVIGGAILVAPVSINWSATQKGFTISLDKASAKVGKPLSAGSVAGVHRRQERRDTRQTPPK
jgi:hypothetical protein